LVVEPGETPGFLADLPITTLEMLELTDVFARLGLTTLGSLAALSAADVVGRFGADGRLAHRLARGDDDHPPDLRHPAPDLAVTWMFDPPVDSVDRCAYAARALGDELHDDLSVRGLSCTRVAIEVETESGREQMRLWRHQGALSAAALADRARWQLESWLERGGAASGVDSGLVRLTLIPDEVVAAGGRQLGLWGARSDRADDVTRVVARLQAMLGPDAVTVPEYRGGVGPGERLRMVPAAVVDLAEERPGVDHRFVGEPWPDMIPPPSPARVNLDPVPIDVVGDGDHPIGVNGRGELSGQPRRITSPSGVPTRAPSGVVASWAGPWPAQQRWWDPLTSSRRARLQVVLEDGSAHLLMLERGAWHIEATYD
jgi:protein ImuB